MKLLLFRLKKKVAKRLITGSSCIQNFILRKFVTMDSKAGLIFPSKSTINTSIFKTLKKLCFPRNRPNFRAQKAGSLSLNPTVRKKGLQQMFRMKFFAKKSHIYFHETFHFTIVTLHS